MSTKVSSGDDDPRSSMRVGRSRRPGVPASDAAWESLSVIAKTGGHSGEPLHSERYMGRVRIILAAELRMEEKGMNLQLAIRTGCSWYVF